MRRPLSIDLGVVTTLGPCHASVGRGRPGGAVPPGLALSLAVQADSSCTTSSVVQTALAM